MRQGQMTPVFPMKRVIPQADVCIDLGLSLDDAWGPTIYEASTEPWEYWEEECEAEDRWYRLWHPEERV